MASWGITSRLKTLPTILYVFILAIVVRWLAFFAYYFIYRTPGGIAPLPEAGDVYQLLALRILGGDRFAFSSFAYRPPLNPLISALVYLVFSTQNSVLAVFVQATLLSAPVCLIAYALGIALGLERRAALFSAWITALDPASIGYSLPLQAETTSNLFIAFALLFLARLLKNHNWRDTVACGGSLALASLARPNAIYFVVPILLLLVIVRIRSIFGKSLVLVFVFAIGVLPWYIRNYLYTGQFTFATTGSFNLLFYRGVSVEHAATGKSIAEIETEFAYDLERRLGVAGPRESYDRYAIWRQLVPSDPRANSAMLEMAFEIYREHPFAFLAIIPKQLVKLLALTDIYAVLGNARWLELIFNGVLYSASAIGVWDLIRRRQWLVLAVTLVPIIYFIGVPLIAGGIQDTCARTNVTVCFAILAGCAIHKRLDEHNL